MNDDLQSVAGSGDGGDFAVSDTFLSRLIADARLTAGDAGFGRLWQARVDSRNTRLAQWPKQSSDNRKHKEQYGDELPEPFDGACDQRIRYADMVTNEKVMLSVLAMIRGAVRVIPAEGSDVNYAGNLELVRRYLLQSVLGWEWFREWIKMGNYVYGESPGVGKMRVVWSRRTELEYKTVTLEELAALFVQVQVDELGGASTSDEDVMAQAEQFVAAFSAPEADEGDLADMVQGFFPFVNRKRAREVVRGLRSEEASARFPAPRVAFEGPELKAQSYLSEWVVPSGSGEFQRCDEWFEWEWLSEAEVKERRVSEGWSEEFVTALLDSSGTSGTRAHEGQVLFAEYGMDEHGRAVAYEAGRYRGLFQVVHAFVRVANDDNIPGRYRVTFHPDVKVAATKMVLIDYAHGKWPGHVVQREVLSDRLLDSRGIPELASGTQSMLKLHSDGLGDYGQISYTPMLKAPRRWEGSDVEVAPMGILENKGAGGGDGWNWLAPPQFPSTAEAVIGRVQQMGDEYFGRPGPGVSPETTRLHDEYTVFWWLTNVAEVTRQVLQLAQQYMSDEMLQRVTNKAGASMLRGRDDIQGQFDVKISFDPRMLDPDFLEKAGGFIQGVLMGIDKENTVQTSALVETLMWQFWPEMADMTLRDVDQAALDELGKERENYQMMLSGEEPPMVDDGSQNYQVRLQFYQQLEQGNPMVFAGLAEDRVALLQARTEHLQAMIEQFGENAQIGRQGAVSGGQRIREGIAASDER